MDLIYNTQRPQLIIREYGRNVQKMIEHCVSIEDREERTRMAHAVIKVIGRLNPKLRNSENGDHTLWDHLFIMSNFKLDIDSPFPMPKPEDLNTQPSIVPYPNSKVRYGHYGKNVELFIEKCIAMEDGEDKDAFIAAIANLMKRNFVSWNRDTVEDDVIMNDLKSMSKKKLELKDPSLLLSADELGKRTDIVAAPKGRGGGKNNRGRNSKKRSGGGGGGNNRRKKRY